VLQILIDDHFAYYLFANNIHTNISSFNKCCISYVFDVLNAYFCAIRSTQTSPQIHACVGLIADAVSYTIDLSLQRDIDCPSRRLMKIM